jgi:hypothetical protein
MEDQQARKSTKGSEHSRDKSQKKGILGKRARPGIELNYEYEHEREDIKAKSMEKIKAKRAKTDKTVDF